MNPVQQAGGPEGASGTRRGGPPAEDRASYLPYPEGPPWLSLLVAGFLTFLLLLVSPFFMLPALDGFQRIVNVEMGPLFMLLPTFSIQHMVESLLGSLVLMVMSLALVMTQRRRPFPSWFPYAVSLPIAWLLILPSKLEEGGPWIAWVILGALAAGLFCIHWRTFQWARTIWD